MIREVNVNNPKEWNDIIRSFPSYDVYYLPQYGKLSETLDDGEYKLILFESSNGRIINPFIKRHVPWLINNEQYFDIITPYGYGGPIIIEATDRESLKNEYSQAFGEYCRENKIVSEFIRFHPIFENYKDVDDSYDVVYSRHTVGTNLRDYDDPVQAEFAKHLRRDNRRALEKGVAVSLIPSPEGLSTFRRLYEETMDRNHAEAMYYFSDSYYQILENDLRPYVLETQLHYKNEVIASELYFTAGDILHAHLLGSNEKMLELEAGGLLEATVAKWGKEHGYRYIHHGGGRTSDPDDSLFRYKKKFGKNTEFEFYIGKKVWNKEVYEALVGKRLEEGEVRDGNFFPGYRVL